MRGYGRLLQYSHRPPPQPHPSSSCLSRGSILPRHRQRQSYWWKDEGTPFGVRGGRSQKNKASRSEEHTSELQSLMRITYAVFCLKKKNKQNDNVDKYIK